MSVSTLSSRWDLKRDGVLFVVAFPSPVSRHNFLRPAIELKRPSRGREKDGRMPVNEAERGGGSEYWVARAQTPGVFSHVSLLAALSCYKAPESSDWDHHKLRQKQMHAPVRGIWI